MKIAVVGIAWYKREDYKALLALFTDSEKLAPNYQEWLKAAERLTDQLRRSGQAFQKVYIDPETFPASRGLNIDANARIRFANEAVAGKNPD